VKGLLKSDSIFRSYAKGAVFDSQCRNFWDFCLIS